MARASRSALALIAALVAAHCCAVRASRPYDRQQRYAGTGGSGAQHQQAHQQHTSSHHTSTQRNPGTHHATRGDSSTQTAGSHAYGQTQGYRQQVQDTGSNSAGGTCTPTAPPHGMAYGGEYSPPKEPGLANYHGTCADAANTYCEPCNIWRRTHVANNICLLQVQNCQNGFFTSGDDLILPNHPIRGIEDMTSSKLHLVNLAEIWGHAWQHLTSAGAKTVPPGNAGLVINSANYRSEHQMHIHMGTLDKTFQDNCVDKVIPGTSFDKTTTFTCAVPEWVYNHCHAGTHGCYDGWQLTGNKKTAAIKAVTTQNLATVWKTYVTGEGHHPTGVDEYHTGLAVVRNPKKTAEWLVIMFSSEAPNASGGVGDHELLWEH